MSVGQVLTTLSSSEVAEWIAELGVLRPEDERAAMGQPAPALSAPAGVLQGGPTQGRQDVPFFGADGPAGFWTPEELERQKRGSSAAELAQFDQLVRAPGAVST